MIDYDNVKEKAEEELDNEEFREQVDIHKAKLRKKKPFLSKIFPWKITIQKV
jgi:hypothetical protein